MMYQDSDSKENESKTPDMGLDFLRNRSSFAPKAQAQSDQSPMSLKTIADAFGMNRDYDQFANGMCTDQGQNRPMSLLESVVAGFKKDPDSDGFANASDKELNGLAPLAGLYRSNNSKGDDERIAREEVKDLLTSGPARRWKKVLDETLNRNKMDVGTEEFRSNMWRVTVEDANTELGKVTDRLGMLPQGFDPDDTMLFWMANNVITQTCRDIVESTRNNEMYGCANLGRDTTAYLGGQSLQTYPTTILSNAWDDEHAAAAMSHEVSHLVSFRVRQILVKHDEWREANGAVQMDRAEFKRLLGKFDDLNRGLDDDDAAYFNHRTGRVEIDKQSDVWSALHRFVDEYIAGIQRAARRRRK
ncbi:MAG: hypothetical protein J6T45_02780 [Fibrobacterales bacterium]|nr:hypothetical protein [Fibrobacterales bacterium]